MEYLADNLIYLRKYNGFTQDDVAEKMYVSRQAVSKWEHGDSIPDFATIVALSELYGVKIDDLIKTDLKESSPKKADLRTKFADLVRSRNKQTARLMIIWSIALLTVCGLICGILHALLHRVTEYIWLVWFFFAIVPPIIFAIRFWRNIGKEWFLFFINVPCIAGIMYYLNVFAGNTETAWCCFLIIPVYYAIAVFVCIYIKKQKKKKKSNADGAPNESDADGTQESKQ